MLGYVAKSTLLKSKIQWLSLIPAPPITLAPQDPELSSGFHGYLHKHKVKENKSHLLKGYDRKEEKSKMFSTDCLLNPCFLKNLVQGLEVSLNSVV